MFDRRLLKNVDWVLAFTVLIICLVGVVAIHSATINSTNLAPYRNKQIYWILLGFLVAFFTTFINYRILVRFSYLFYFVMLVLLVLVLFYGTGGPGSPVKRWLPIGPFFLQPSEFVKFALVLVLSKHFSNSRRVGDLGASGLIWPSLIMLVPLVLIVKQPDLGTGLLLLIVFIPMIFLAGIRLKTLGIIGTMLMIMLPVIWSFALKPYQKNRLLTWLNPDRDPLGTGYHVIQSKIAVGSGGMWGKGFTEGTQGQLNFLPAHHTDFIFAVFAEEWGFVGSVVVLVLFLFLILWALINTTQYKERSSIFLTVGVVGIMTSQIFINIGMVLGLMPVVGVPLPFFSYGGSSLLSLMFGIGLLLNIRMRNFED